MDISDQELVEVAQSLLNKQVITAQKVAAGGNSRLYKVRTDEKSYALKLYPPELTPQHNRLSAEVRALQFFEASRITRTPKYIAADPQARCIIMEWCEGDLIGGNVTQEDIGSSLQFISAIAQNAHHTAPSDFDTAAEACLSAGEISKQIQHRLDRLQLCFDHEPALKLFIEETIFPCFSASEEEARAGYRQNGLIFEVALPHEYQTLIPADFGFHNVMKSKGGNITFLDFEYFGWDDPVKLTADFLLHPGMSLSRELRQSFVEGMVRAFAKDESFSKRLNLLHNLYGVRWTLILLNEFLPEKWNNRRFAMGGDGTKGDEQAQQAWSEAKLRQLRKAKIFIKNIFKS